jgi:hypothetical protein
MKISLDASVTLTYNNKKNELYQDYFGKTHWGKKNNRFGG